MKTNIKVEHKRAVPFTTFLRKDKKAKIATILLGISLVFFALAYYIQTFRIAEAFLGASFVLLIGSAYGLSMRLRYIDANEYRTMVIDPRVAAVKNLQKIRVWIFFLAGLALIGLSLVLDTYLNTGIFVVVNPFVFLAGVITILLGVGFLYLKFLAK